MAPLVGKGVQMSSVKVKNFKYIQQFHYGRSHKRIIIANCWKLCILSVEQGVRRRLLNHHKAYGHELQNLSIVEFMSSNNLLLSLKSN